MNVYNCKRTDEPFFDSLDLQARKVKMLGSKIPMTIGLSDYKHTRLKCERH